MGNNGAKHFVEGLLSLAGITINGDKPYDIRVHNSNLYERILSHGSLGLGEGYMAGRWDCEQLDIFFDRILRAALDTKIPITFSFLFQIFKAKFFNMQSYRIAAKNVQQHYDIGNDLYTAMLDKRMVYTCAYRTNTHNLDDAQEAKLDLVCKKIGLTKGQKVLDIGCGRGSWAKFAAEKYGAHVVGITLSKEQVALGQKLCAGLPIDIRLQDYRDVHEKFDHIISLGMFEHVGYKNYRTYMEVARRCLKDNGLFLLHTIGGNTSATNLDPRINKYIFPGGVLPSVKQISDAIAGLFIMEDWHNFGVDYDKTLMAWYANVANNWKHLQHYDEQFQRMWRYYLLSCAGSFRARVNQLRQIVLSPNGVEGGYISIR